ncbi:MAG: SpoIIE family protein phosphatase [Fusicatenibacter sp.]|nr:SpoIIE family protein phosphatase [Lachnospiraceae bacterium]MDY2938592.1 SpoIIE family protein phosphatase [Fusicatenibacter sp.]
MPGWVIAMFAVSAVLILRDMAKTFFETRRSRREAAVYDFHPQKLQMERYASTFRNLAEVFYCVPCPKEYLTKEQTDRMLLQQQNTVCENCPKASWCWDQYQYLTRQQCVELLDAFASEEEDKQNLAKGEWISHCLNGTRFLEKLNSQYQKERQNFLWTRRMAENRIAVAEQFNEMAGIMNRAARELYSLNSLPDELSEKIRSRMKKNGVCVQKVWMQEKPREHLKIFVTMKAGKHCKMTLRQAAAILSELCGTRLVAVRDDHLVLSSEFSTILFCEDVKYQVLYGVGRITKEKESISGDNYSTLCEDGRFVLCLSDGMGSGYEANKESEMVVELFEKFLKSGFSRETAARMINSVMVLRRNDGMFSTVDIGSIDLYSGVCSFLKAGAAPSFIRRDTWVDTISSTSLAAGLLQQLNFDTAQKKMYDGDFLIMVTDGVIDALPKEEPEERMKQMLLEIQAGEPREFARELLEQVLRIGEYKARDDMTVLAARIWKK